MLSNTLNENVDDIKTYYFDDVCVFRNQSQQSLSDIFNKLNAFQILTYPS